MKRYIILTAAALALTACASASNPGAMVPAVSSKTLIQDSSKLSNAVSVGMVDGGKETNPLWTSEVSDADFAEALRQSLAAHAMLATDDGNYRLDANLEKLKQPAMGINMKVTSTVNYTLTDIATDTVVYQDTIEMPYTAKMGDAFVGTKRLQLANEGSIKSNIAAMLEQIIVEVDGVSNVVALKMIEPNTL